MNNVNKNVIYGHGAVEVVEGKFSGLDPQPKSIRRVNDDGSHIRCTPKDIGYRKNVASKAKPTAYINYNQPVPVDSIICEGRAKEGEVYFAEWGLTDIKNSAKFRNEDADDCVNNRWKYYTKLTKEEQEVLKASRI
jgi:hypothetical protein